MIKKMMPFVHATNIYDINVGFYKQFNIKYLFIDLDNTLDSYKTKVPSLRAKELITLLKENGIEPIIISNNSNSRVLNYANALGVECLHSARKPFAYKIKKMLAARNIDVNEVMMVGDQMVTDIPAANRAHIKSILTDKLVKEDQPTTHINRLIERPFRSYCNRKHKFTEWRDIYNGED